MWCFLFLLVTFAWILGVKSIQVLSDERCSIVAHQYAVNIYHRHDFECYKLFQSCYDWGISLLQELEQAVDDPTAVSFTWMHTPNYDNNSRTTAKSKHWYWHSW